MLSTPLARADGCGDWSAEGGGLDGGVGGGVDEGVGGGGEGLVEEETRRGGDAAATTGEANACDDEATAAFERDQAGGWRRFVSMLAQVFGAHEGLADDGGRHLPNGISVDHVHLVEELFGAMFPDRGVCQKSGEHSREVSASSRSSAASEGACQKSGGRPEEASTATDGEQESEGARRESGERPARQLRWIPPSAHASEARRKRQADRIPRLRRRLGRVTIRLRVRRSTLVQWRTLERQAIRWLRRGATFLRFVSLSVWDGWKHHLGEDRVMWGRIYARDLFRCTSPVCTCRCVTPHHIVFRSHGGGHADENLTSLCPDCHLELLHGHRLSVEGQAPELIWRLGSDGKMVVVGRELRAA